MTLPGCQDEGGPLAGFPRLVEVKYVDPGASTTCWLGAPDRIIDDSR